MTEWFQKLIPLQKRSQGCYLITNQILSQISPQLSEIQIGMCNILLMHTSAGLIIMENADPTVRADMNTFFNKLVPEGKGLYEHDDEGPDDMPAHIKSALTGVSLNVPISKGRLVLGTWQGIWLMEYRKQKQGRQVMVSLQGKTKTQ